MASLFTDPTQAPRHDIVATDALLLRGFADTDAAILLAALQPVLQQAPPRQMLTPGGRRMSVENTNCGPLGWVSDHHGYRYVMHDPLTNQPWPPMPEAFIELADAAARAAGFGTFTPDAGLINIYVSGTRMSLHQDRDEKDMSAPIVSVSLGLPATFLFGGATRRDKPQRIPLLHGDVIVWGGASRLVFHGIAPLAEGEHPLTGNRRINLTLRKAR